MFLDRSDGIRVLFEAAYKAPKLSVMEFVDECEPALSRRVLDRIEGFWY
jgi:hypothetical protein